MKKAFYQIHEQITDNCYLYMNTMTENFMFMDKYAHTMYSETENVDDIKVKDPNIYNLLKDNGLIVDDDYDERAIVELRRRNEQYDTSMYHIVINPTLGCNLSCWYCYEHKISKSRISDDVREGIKKHIMYHYAEQPYRILRLSFFGGEPLMCFDAVTDIIRFAKPFCDKHEIRLSLDFTTNGTLLNEERVKSLSEYECTFQITLDGSRKQHNKIKFTSNKDTDTYALTIRNIKLIQEFIPDSATFVRINFDNDTLKDFDEILADIDFLDRRRSEIILKKVWQVGKEKINKDEIISAIEKLFSKGFSVDYYTQGHLCFAEKLNEAVINYDGNVFKCTTIDKFSKENSYGTLDCQTGRIEWDENRIALHTADITTDKCRLCNLYPTCYGPCNLHIMAGDTNCFLNGINLSMKEYLMFSVKKARLKMLNCK